MGKSRQGTNQDSDIKEKVEVDRPHLKSASTGNQAGSDTAQVTDFIQTWHKCQVWQVKDCGTNLHHKLFYSL